MGQIITPRTIWQLKQNKISLLAKDLAHAYHSPSEVMDVLLCRGVFKWFSVRRQLIKLKDQLKIRLWCAENEAFNIKTMGQASSNYGRYTLAYLKGYKAAIVEVREELRALCHSQRWQVQDNDEMARQWLELKEEQVKKRIIMEEESRLG